ncbi:MAG: hypothetical protein KTR35_11775 [Gammaproteobacteria bacterium]|nr:hypothetical protein [Gammaproteobacteria bacterium]
MSLIVPQRRAALSHSFPMEANRASSWLASLRPLHSTSDAREVLRGLKHSNRLSASTRERRAVMECFIPVLADLHEHLSEQCLAQPLPLTTEFQSAATLLGNLLREEAYTYKILVSEEPEPKALEISLALYALVKHTELSVHTYRTISNDILQDAQQLFALAERQKILESDTGTIPISHQYAYMLLLSLADTYQVRVRQMPLLLSFLQENLDCAKLLSEAPDASTYSTIAIELGKSIQPAAAASLLTKPNGSTRWLDLKPINQRIVAKMNAAQSNPTPTLGADTLEKRTLARLQMAFNRNRRRRSARSITHTSIPALFGHQEICAAIAMVDRLDETASMPGEPVERSQEDLEALYTEHTGWLVTNHSTHGLCLSHSQCLPGTVQVGQLLGLPGATQTRLAVVRWMKATDQSAITLGAELLSKSVMAVSISQDDSELAEDNGLIFACKVHDTVVQTIMLPAYRFKENDSLTVKRKLKSRKVQLGSCLQHNGLFGHFVLSGI